MVCFIFWFLQAPPPESLSAHRRGTSLFSAPMSFFILFLWRTQALSTNHPVPIITKMTQTFIITNFPQCINVGTSKIRFLAISCDVNDKCSLQRLQPGGKAFIHIVVLVIISLSVLIYQKCTIWIINRQAFQYFTSRRKETNLKLTASICF